jgi:hypothetical protein
MAKNYAISLDSGKLGLDRCVELITGLTKLRQENAKG